MDPKTYKLYYIQTYLSCQLLCLIKQDAHLVLCFRKILNIAAGILNLYYKRR